MHRASLPLSLEIIFLRRKSLESAYSDFEIVLEKKNPIVLIPQLRSSRHALRIFDRSRENAVHRNRPQNWKEFSKSMKDSRLEHLKGRSFPSFAQ